MSSCECEAVVQLLSPNCNCVILDTYRDNVLHETEKEGETDEWIDGENWRERGSRS